MNSTQINVAVTGTGSLIGQAIIKCIKASKYSQSVHLIGCDYFSGTVGSYWCAENFVLTDIYKNPHLESVWLEEIKQIIKDKAIRFVFVGVDFELPLFAKYKKELEATNNVKIIVSNSQVITIGNDKYKTVQFLKDNGLAYPKTTYFEDGNLEDISYPIIVKPAVGARSRGVYIVADATDLAAKASTITRPIIQEMIGTSEDEYTCGVLMLEGKFISSIVLRRTLKEGNTAKAFHRHDFPENIGQYIKEIAEKLKPFGSCNLQLRVDKNGVPKLFEINPRHSGTTYMRAHFGYNEVEMILDYFLEGRITSPSLREGVVVRHFEETFFNL